MKLSDGLFLESTRKVAREYTDIAYDERIVDAACMQLVMKPEKFDVLLLPNLYGDIVSDLCAGLVGGLGVVPGANLGVDAAVSKPFTAARPDIAGKNLANPTALLLSGLMMLEHIGERAARAHESARRSMRVLADGPFARAISEARRRRRSSRTRSARRLNVNDRQGRDPQSLPAVI